MMSRNRPQPPARSAEDARQSPRTRLPAAFTLIRARSEGGKEYTASGRVLDLSPGGIGFELDREVSAGDRLEVRAMLPGRALTVLAGRGRVAHVRPSAEAATGGRIFRVGMELDAEKASGRRASLRLRDYLEGCGLAAA